MSLFVTFEGIEGSGKSSHAQALAAALRAHGRRVVETREPGGTAAGTAIRALVLGSDTVPLTGLAELFLYCADRAQHVAQVIRPALSDGQIVVCDRFSDSTVAYQGHGRGLDLELVRTIDAHARGGLVPSLTVLLDCPVDVGLARARARAGLEDRFERETVAFHERIRAGFLALASAAPERVMVVDSTAPSATVDARVLAATLARLGTAT